MATAAADREARRSENGWPIAPRSSRSRAARYQGRHRQFSLTMRRTPAASQPLHDRQRLGEARRQRLLTEDVLARCRRLQRVVAMGLDRGGDIDRVDRGMIEECIELIEARHAELGGERSRSFRAAVPHADHGGARNLSPAGELNTRGVSGAEQSDADHSASPAASTNTAPRSTSSRSSPGGKKSPRAIASSRSVS